MARPKYTVYKYVRFVLRRESHTPLFRLRLPARAVDATPSSALIRECSRRRSIWLYSAKIRTGQRPYWSHPAE